MIATTIEQSRHLLELGLDPDSADMYYTGHRSIFNPKEIEYTQEPRVRTKFVSFDRLEVFFPAWSLSALLEVMPAHLKGWPADEDERLTLVKYHRMDADGPCYVINYSNPLNGSFAFPKLAHNPITAAYEMVCWLLEQGLIEKGGQND